MNTFTAVNRCITTLTLLLPYSHRRGFRFYTLLELIFGISGQEFA